MIITDEAFAPQRTCLAASAARNPLFPLAVVVFLLCVGFGRTASGTTPPFCFSDGVSSVCSVPAKGVIGICSTRNASSASISPATPPRCCSSSNASSGDMWGVSCSSVPYFRTRPTNADLGTSVWQCGSDGAQLRCAAGLVTSVCFGDQCAGCSSGVGGTTVAIRCTEPGPQFPLRSEVNTSSAACRWVFASRTSSSELLQCLEDREVMTGVCRSPQNLFCSGTAFGIHCCSLVAGRLSVSSSQSFTVTRSVSLSNTLSAPSATESLPSVSFTPSPSPTDRSASPSRSRGSVSPSTTPTVSTNLSQTVTLQSRTVPSQTVQLSLPLAPVARAFGSVSAAAIHAGPTSIRVSLSGALWRARLTSFMLPHFLGTQLDNSFAFRARQGQLFDSAVVNGLDGAGTILVVSFRQDQCFDPRDGGETVRVRLPPLFVEPYAEVAFDLFFPGVEITTREQTGLAVGIASVVLMFVSTYLGASSIVLFHLISFQNLVLIGHHSCSRVQLSSYYNKLIWLYQPTRYAPAFSQIPDLGVVLVHFVVAVAVLGLHLVLCRYFRRPCAYFPAIPFSVAFGLLQGLCNAAWRAVTLTDQSVALRVVGAVLSVVYVVGLLLTIRRYGDPRGLTFLRYPSGPARAYYRGNWVPLSLHNKYSPLVVAWAPGYSVRANASLIVFYATSAVLTAFLTDNTDKCFAVQISLLAVHGTFLVYLFWLQPTRNVVALPLICIPLVAKFLVIIGLVASLDCQGRFPTNVRFGEAIAVIGLAFIFLSAAATAIAALHENWLVGRIDREEGAEGEAWHLQVESQAKDRIDNDVYLASEEMSSLSAVPNRSHRDEASSSPRPPRETRVPVLTHFAIADTVEEDPVVVERVKEEQRAAALAALQPAMSYETIEVTSNAVASNSPPDASEAHDREGRGESSMSPHQPQGRPQRDHSAASASHKLPPSQQTVIPPLLLAFPPLPDSFFVGMSATTTTAAPNATYPSVPLRAVDSAAPVAIPRRQTPDKDALRRAKEDQSPPQTRTAAATSPQQQVTSPRLCEACHASPAKGVGKFCVTCRVSTLL